MTLFRDLFLKLICCKHVDIHHPPETSSNSSNSSTQKRIKRIRKKLIKHNLDNIEHSVNKKAVKRAYHEIQDDDDETMIFRMSI